MPPERRTDAQDHKSRLVRSIHNRARAGFFHVSSKLSLLNSDTNGDKYQYQGELNTLLYPWRNL